MADDKDKSSPPTEKGKPYERQSNQYNLPPPLSPTIPEETPQMSRKDPSIPSTAATTSTSKQQPRLSESHVEKERKPFLKRLCTYCYDKQNGKICERTYQDWVKIVCYSTMYLIFLATYTMVLLYISLVIIKQSDMSRPTALVDFQTYSPYLIGLTAVPVSEYSYPLIWYRSDEAEDYAKYVTALDRLLEKKRQKRQSASDLGPCGQRPYGYGEQPCVVVKINKQWKWKAKPLQPNSPNLQQAPMEVKHWLKKDTNKFWLHCEGFHSYDKEHIGKIAYYPDPPGFDADLFPLNRTHSSPLVAIQLSNFTLGISLAVECKLWYDNGQADVSFMLYVTPKPRKLIKATNINIFNY